MKSAKYRYEFGSVRGALAAIRLIGAGNPPLHRFRVGLELALSGHRELDGMLSEHARRAGRLDGAAVDAVLEAAGHRLPRRREALAGLTAREVEVLILLARGLSNKQIAERLVITPKTAGNHVEHIYAKIDASSRASAAMFAVQHGLIPEEKLASTPRAVQGG